MDPVTGAFTAFLVAALPMAVLVTKGVDTIRNLVDPTARFPKVIWNVVAFVVGVAICLGWGFNPVAGLAAAVPALSNGSALTGTAGEILSGLALGAMAGFWHEKLDQWSASGHNPGGAA
jgi:hypothetical protein